MTSTLPDRMTAANFLRRHRRKFQLKLSDVTEFADGTLFREYYSRAGQFFTHPQTRQPTAILTLIEDEHRRR